MYCMYCGNQIPDESVYCKYCGRKLLDTEEISEIDLTDENSSEEAATGENDNIDINDDTDNIDESYKPRIIHESEIRSNDWLVDDVEFKEDYGFTQLSKGTRAVIFVLLVLMVIVVSYISYNYFY